MSEIRFFEHSALRDLATQLLLNSGVAKDDAEIVSTSLVSSNLCGHDSHGIIRVPEYIQLIRDRALVSDASFTVLNETPSAIAIDAAFGFGQIQMKRLIDSLQKKADQAGIACGTMRNCGHVGRLGEWVEIAAESGRAALLAVNDNGVLKCVAPPGGVEPRISTNPIAIGVPTSGDPLVLDISTSQVANGKIRVAYNAKDECPDGWLIDAQGNPTNDPNLRYQDPPATILPMGGYKGFGLGLLFDILIGGLSGGCCPPAGPDDVDCNNVLMLMWTPSQFQGDEHFLSEADKLIEFVRGTKRSESIEEIRLPHDRSRKTAAERKMTGIPLDSGTWQSLVDLAGEYDIPLPKPIV